MESGRNKRRRKSSLVALARAVARKGSVMASASFVSYLPICHGHGYRSEVVKASAPWMSNHENSTDHPSGLGKLVCELKSENAGPKTRIG